LKGKGNTRKGNEIGETGRENRLKKWETKKIEIGSRRARLLTKKKGNRKRRGHFQAIGKGRIFQEGRSAIKKRVSRGVREKRLGFPRHDRGYLTPNRARSTKKGSHLSKKRRSGHLLNYLKEATRGKRIQGYGRGWKNKKWGAAWDTAQRKGSRGQQKIKREMRSARGKGAGRIRKNICISPPTGGTPSSASEEKGVQRTPRPFSGGGGFLKKTMRGRPIADVLDRIVEALWKEKRMNQH